MQAGNLRFYPSAASEYSGTSSYRYEYDSFGRCSKKWLPGAGSTDYTEHVYDLASSILSLLGGTGKVYVANYYDVKGRVTRTARSQPDFCLKQETAYTFTGNPQTVNEWRYKNGTPTVSGKYTYAYDSCDRPESVKFDLNHSGTSITLAAYTYDKFGRLQSREFHGASANKLTYAYNLRGWLTGISGSKFTQTLYYNTGTGAVKYNGSISSMTWKAGDESTVRGYKFTYDGLDRMQSSTYGETASINTNVNRFSENVTGYDKNGNIKSLQRYSQTAASAYGLIDNLTFTLDGNRLNRVDDAVTASAYNGGFEFKDGAKQANEYAYDANGNLTKDLNKGITNISYNCLNLPSVVTFSDGSTITYTYAADGTKLKTVHKIGSTTTTTDYCGNVVYGNGVWKLLLTEEGYVTLSDSKYHYYLKDYQGNNRVVVNSSGNVEETNHYYPFGGVFANSTTVQPYKYNGKEFDTKKGLNWYDYGARHYDAALGRFHTNDSFAEKYYPMSPYQYGANNPVGNIDVNGDSIVVLNYTSGEHLGLLIQNSSNRWEYYSFNGDKIYNSTEGSSGGGPQDNKGELSWSSPQEFLDSEYNQNASKEDIESGKVNGYGYQEGYLIPTTEKQDGTIRKAFIEAVDQGYSLIGNHCSVAVQKSLNKAGIETKNNMEVTNRQMGEVYNVKINPYLPSKAYQAIKKNNSQGYTIRRNK